MNDNPPPYQSERRAAVRRKADRLRCVLDVPRETDVLYLSAGGMMVSLEFTPELGSLHRFSLGFPDRILVLSGIVRNVEHLPGSAGEFRVGIEFQDVTADDHAFLEAFVAERLA